MGAALVAGFLRLHFAFTVCALINLVSRGSSEAGRKRGDANAKTAPT